MQHCPRCKFAISSTARFCARCGLKLSETNQNPPSAALAKPAVPTKPLSISGPLPSESTTIQQADKKASTAGSVSGPLTPSSARGASEQVEAPLLASKNEQETIQPVNTPSTASISDQAEQGAEAKALPAPTSEQDATQTQEAKEDKAETTKKSTRSTAPLSTSTGPLTGQSHISGPLPSPSPAAEKHKQVATVSGLQAAEKLQTDVSEQDETLATNAGTILSSGKQAKAPAPKQSATPETGEMTARAALRSTTRDLKPIISSETDVTTEAQADQQAIKSGQAEAEDEPSHKISSSDEEEDIPDSGKEDIATTSRPVSGPLDASQVAKSTRKSIVPKRPTGPIPPRPTTQKEAQAASSSRFRVPSRPLSSSPNFPPVPETPHIDQPRKSSTAPLQEEGQGQQEQEGSSFLPVPETPAPQSLETEERNTLPTIPETPYPSMLEATYPSTEIEEPQDIADQATRPYAAHKDEEQEAQSQQEPEQPVTSSYPPSQSVEVVRTSTPPPPRLKPGGEAKKADDAEGEEHKPEYLPQPVEIIRASTPRKEASEEPVANVYVETAPIHGQTQAQIEQGADPYYVLLNLESLATTNEAAEQWRKGWRDRQRAEAGPAVGIPRGQASVSQPLMAMQHSLARMRAVILEQSKKAEQSLGPNVRFWFTIASMSFLIVLLGAYLLWSFLPGSQFASQSITAAVSGPPPILALQNSTTSSFTAGQELRIQGAYFNAHSTVNFLLGSTRLQDTAQSTAQGTFTTEIHLPATLLAGSYALQAQDHHTGQNAFLSLTILPRLDATINTTPLEFITPGGPISDGLPFAIARGNNTPSTRQITIINTSGAPLQWNATALADNNLSWLSIDNGKSSGTLPAQGTDTITISATATDLASSSTPYMGHLIFTVGKQQAVIPVSLRVPATGNEVIVSSIPMSAVIQPGGGCLPTALTFINLGNEKVEWQATVNPSDSMYIHLDKSISSHGTLQPSGQDGDTAATYLTCTGVHIGENLYHITVQYNGITQDVPVSVLS